MNAGVLMLGLFSLLVFAAYMIEAAARRDEAKRRALHRASFAPSATILCHENYSEAGSSRTIAALTRRLPA